MVFRESRRTRRRKQKARRADRFKGADRVSGKQSSRQTFRNKRTTTIAKIMLATEFGKKQGGIQKIGSAIMENVFSKEEDSSRNWNDMLDPFGLAGRRPLAPPVPQGSADDRQKPFTARPGPATIPVAGASKLQTFLGVTARKGLSTAAEWWLGQASKGGGDTSTQLMLSVLEDVQFAIYINNKLISVVDELSFIVFMHNMKRNLQLRTRGLRSD